MSLLGRRQTIPPNPTLPGTLRDPQGWESIAGQNTVQERVREGQVWAGVGPRPEFLRTCANRSCDSGWLHLLRRRSAPVFEGGWTCSPACTRGLVEAAVRRECEGRAAASSETRGHRIPLGLTMLEQGWINSAQLRRAVERAAHCRWRQAGRDGLYAARACARNWSPARSVCNGAARSSASISTIRRG